MTNNILIKNGNLRNTFYTWGIRLPQVTKIVKINKVTTEGLS